MEYKFTPRKQLLSGLVSFFVAALVTYLFNHEVAWALAIALGVGTFFSAGFYHTSNGSNDVKNIKFANVLVFILFFGIALIEAFQEQNWLGALLFLALGILSLWADLRKN